jgi:hypothetical protein
LAAAASEQIANTAPCACRHNLQRGGLTSLALRWRRLETLVNCV